MNIYPLKFSPILKERLWGGDKLDRFLGKKIPTDTTGESWELSAVAGEVSVVSEGELKGVSLQTLIDEHGERLLGRSVIERFGKTFPILIKFIDAKQDLSIQLHPNDTLAKERHNSFGKTEMWYVMDADPNAQLIVGFEADVEKAAYVKSLEQNTLEELLHYETVAEGDTFFINTGKIHAIGAGVLLAEIQQTSDVTYRVFDFNRKDKNGQLRELHTDLALDAIDYTRKDDFKVTYDTKKDNPNVMVDCPYFKTSFLDLTTTMVRNTLDRDAFTIYMCVAGSATVINEYGFATIKKGETVLVPACSNQLRKK